MLFGAVLTAEDEEISVGASSIVMENALIRGRARHPAAIGEDVLTGPHAHVNGARWVTAASWPPVQRCSRDVWRELGARCGSTASSAAAANPAHGPISRLGLPSRPFAAAAAPGKPVKLVSTGEPEWSTGEPE